MTPMNPSDSCIPRACWRWGVLYPMQVGSTPRAPEYHVHAGTGACCAPCKWAQHHEPLRKVAWQAPTAVGPGKFSESPLEPPQAGAAGGISPTSPGKGRQQAQEQHIGCQQQAGVGQEGALVALAHAAVHHRAVVVEALHTPAAGARFRMGSGLGVQGPGS